VADLRPFKLTGNVAEKALERVGITLNKNAIPNDPEKPMVTSGIRIGSPSGTSRGFSTAEFRAIGSMIMCMLQAVSENPAHPNELVLQTAMDQVESLCQRFPLPY
jgi:glycine hydroxymethyltransferase